MQEDFNEVLIVASSHSNAANSFLVSQSGFALPLGGSKTAGTHVLPLMAVLLSREPAFRNRSKIHARPTDPCWDEKPILNVGITESSGAEVIRNLCSKA
jgi:hypothetical protein